MVKDAFDLLVDEIESEDPFYQVKSSEEESVDSLKSHINEVLSKFDDKARKKEHAQIKAEFEKTLKAEISKIKPVQNVIERQVEQVIKHEQVPIHLEPKIIKSPPQIVKEIKEIRVEVPSKVNLEPYAEKKTIKELETRIEELKAELEKVKSFSLGGSGVIGIPPPEPNPSGYVLTVNTEKKAQWKASSGGGLAVGTFTVNNNTPEYTLDPTSSSIDTLYQVVATLIRKLQGEI